MLIMWLGKALFWVWWSEGECEWDMATSFIKSSAYKTYDKPWQKISQERTHWARLFLPLH